MDSWGIADMYKCPHDKWYPNMDKICKKIVQNIFIISSWKNDRKPSRY